MTQASADERMASAEENWMAQGGPPSSPSSFITQDSANGSGGFELEILRMASMARSWRKSHTGSIRFNYVEADSTP